MEISGGDVFQSNLDASTRLVDCPDCGDTSAYVEIPNGGAVTDRESAESSVQANCTACDAEFRVYYITE